MNPDNAVVQQRFLNTEHRWPCRRHRASPWQQLADRERLEELLHHTAGSHLERCRPGRCWRAASGGWSPAWWWRRRRRRLSWCRGAAELRHTTAPAPSTATLTWTQIYTSLHNKSDGDTESHFTFTSSDGTQNHTSAVWRSVTCIQQNELQYIKMLTEEIQHQLDVWAFLNKLLTMIPTINDVQD